MKICYIGAQGHWQYTLNKVTEHEVVGICPGFSGEDMSGLLSTLKSLGITPKLYHSYRELLDLCDIAVVNTRFDKNAEITAEFLKKNVYVFSEKPLATTKKQLDMVIAAQSNSDAFVSAMFGIRYSGWFLTLKEAIKDLGCVRMINAQKSYKLGIRPDFYKNKNTFGGLIPWVAIHAIDWVHDLCDEEFEIVSAIADNSYNSGNGDLEMTALCQFRTKSGVLASINADYFRPSAADTHDDDRIRVVCTGGVAEYSCGKVTIIDKAGTRTIPILPDEDVFEQFLKRISGESCGVTPEESIYMTEVSLLARDDADNKNKSKKNCGLVSISFRNHTAEEIVFATKNAGLSYIEWGSDLHVPEGDIEIAKAVKKMCKDAGIKVSSYGTYYKLGQNQDIMPYILSAKALESPILRIWAGTSGSHDVSCEFRKQLVLEAKSVCQKAAEYGLKVDFEYHPGTLTDNAESAYKLITEINEPNCGIYWQPNYSKPFLENISSLKKVLSYVDIIHIFFWDEKGTRLFLSEGEDILKEYLDIAKEKNPLLLLEFVPDNNIEFLKGEAQMLFDIIKKMD